MVFLSFSFFFILKKSSPLLLLSLPSIIILGCHSNGKLGASHCRWRSVKVHSPLPFIPALYPPLPLFQRYILRSSRCILHVISLCLCTSSPVFPLLPTSPCFSPGFPYPVPAIHGVIYTSRARESCVIQATFHYDFTSCPKAFLLGTDGVFWRKIVCVFLKIAKCNVLTIANWEKW